jgi:hypothetical protein
MVGNRASYLRRGLGTAILVGLFLLGARALHAYTCADCGSDAWGCVATSDSLTCYYDYGTVKIVRQKIP